MEQYGDSGGVFSFVMKGESVHAYHDVRVRMVKLVAANDRKVAVVVATFRLRLWSSTARCRPAVGNLPHEANMSTDRPVVLDEKAAPFTLSVFGI